ncbi:MAG: tetratricopeptide repeat protein [Endomicrobiaceae bacterium]
MAKKYQIFLLILLSYITIFAFYPALSAGFIGLDDPVMVVENPYITNLSLNNIKEIFSHSYYKLYHPVVTLSYALEYSFFKLDPYIYHLDNILIHLFNTLIVFFIFRRLSKSFTVSYIVALLFAIHPVHVESVAWITARKDNLYSLFYLLSLFLYMQIDDNKNKRLFIGLSAICFLLSCFSKPMAVTLPLILMLTDYYRGKSIKDNIKNYLPFIVGSFIFSLIAVYGHYSPEEKEISTLFLKAIDILNAHHNVLFYIWKCIFPVNLSCLYPNFYDLYAMPPWFVLYSPAVLYLILLFVFLSLKYTKNILFGFLFFVITLLPSSGIMPTGVAHVADRYVYLPYIGLFFIIAESIVYLCKKFYKIKNIIIVFLIVLISVLFYLTYKRAILWTNTEALMTDTINKFPETAEHAYITRGIIYINENRLQEARSDLEKSISIKKNNAYTVFHLGHLAQINKDNEKAKKYYSKIPETNTDYITVINNFAIMLADEGKFDKAVRLMEKTLKKWKFNIPDYYYNTLAIYYYKINNLHKSLENFQLAIKKNPYKSQYYLAVMEIYRTQNNFKLFEETAEECLKHNPDDVSVMNMLGKEYFARGYYDLSEKIFLRSVKIKPNNHLGYFFLGNIAALKKEYKKAITNYTMAALLSKNNGEYYYKRAAVYLILGKYELAKKNMNTAVENGFYIDDDFKNEIEKIKNKGDQK